MLPQGMQAAASHPGHLGGRGLLGSRLLGGESRLRLGDLHMSGRDMGGLGTSTSAAATTVIPTPQCITLVDAGSLPSCLTADFTVAFAFWSSPLTAAFLGACKRKIQGRQGGYGVRQLVVNGVAPFPPCPNVPPWASPRHRAARITGGHGGQVRVYAAFETLQHMLCPKPSGVPRMAREPGSDTGAQSMRGRRGPGPTVERHLMMGMQDSTLSRAHLGGCGGLGNHVGVDAFAEGKGTAEGAGGVVGPLMQLTISDIKTCGKESELPGHEGCQARRAQAKLPRPRHASPESKEGVPLEGQVQPRLCVCINMRRSTLLLTIVRRTHAIVSQSNKLALSL